MFAEHVTMVRVENGWVTHISAGGASITLVARVVDELLGILKGVEWQTPRPLGHDVVPAAPSMPGSSGFR